MVPFLMADEVVNQCFRELQHHGDLDHRLPRGMTAGVKAEMIKHKEEMDWDILETDGAMQMRIANEPAK